MTYETLRKRLNNSERGTAAEGLITNYALGEDSVTAAIVCMAACDVPLDRVAFLTRQDPDEVDALVSLFNARMSRSLREERERRGLGDAA